MKKSFFIILVLSLFLVGCAHNFGETQEVDVQIGSELLEMSKDIIISVHEEGFESVKDMMSPSLYKDIKEADDKDVVELLEDIRENGPILSFSKEDVVLHTNPHIDITMYLVQIQGNFQDDEEVTFRLSYDSSMDLIGFYAQ